MIKGLHIKNYRAFREFKLDKLARVNLIVGQNNTGKTSLLEAVYLLHSRRPQTTLLELMHRRGEYIVSGNDNRRIPGRTAYGYQVVHLFHNRRLGAGAIIDIYDKDTELGLHIGVSNSQGRIVAQQTLPLALDVDSKVEKVNTNTDTTFIVFERIDNTVISFYPLEDEIVITRYPEGMFTQNVDIEFLTTELNNYDMLATKWDKINFTFKEDKVIEALQKIEKNVVRLNFTSSTSASSGAIVKLKNVDGPVPLGSMGEGMQRMLAIAIALVSAENSVLIIDEIDTGLHYSVQRDMWKLILQTAQELNVQVFATTHSWDAVQTFQEALEDSKEHVEDIDELGRLIRLDRKKDDLIVPTVYDYDILQVAVEEGVEVR